LLLCIGYISGRALPRAWQRLNTDFPNYYLTARLVRERFNTNRLYEWIWLQRQKDHIGITRDQQPVVGFIPDTPFSALVLLPLSGWSPLAAKRTWILINVLLLVGIARWLREIAGVPMLHIAFAVCLSFPLSRNLEYGQFYLLVLFLITAALWAYLGRRPMFAGIFLGIAGGLKIFPAAFLLYFLRKKEWKAAGGVIVGAGFSVAASLLAFGVQLHRTFFVQVLPWALRGEILNPYNLTWNSLSSLLHRLLLFEPEWNPHPLLPSPVLFGLLESLLPILVLAPALYLVSPRQDGSCVQLEWSAFLVALLAISTMPASYHFVLLILPVTLLGAAYLRERDYPSVALLLLLYAAICFPAWPRGPTDGWWALAAVPRLYFVLLLCALCYITLSLRKAASTSRRDGWSVWVVALAIVFLAQIALSVRRQHAADLKERTRIATAPDIFLASEPITRGDGLGFIGMRTGGYFAGVVDSSGLQVEPGRTDELSQTSDGQTVWIEAAAAQSQIFRVAPNRQIPTLELSDAEFPIVSPDGRWLAYLRSNRGRSTLWRHSLLAPGVDVAVTPRQFDVEEMTFLPDGSLIFAAMKEEGPSKLYLATPDGRIQPLDAGEARYPAASPDGHWLAYSRVERGVWHLWICDLRNGAARRVTAAACNDLSPAWQADSKTLLYASDCGRALWFTALYRQQVVP
jgi:hypothetical protein